MSGRIPQSNPTVDPYEFLQIVPNPDGTITRNPNRYPNTSPTPALSKDIPINPSTNTWARIFLPQQQQALHNSNAPKKIPLIVYFHGGGFIMCSAASTVFLVFCTNMATELSTIIVSVEYRLAPEHRLPAAYDDAMGALHWINTTNEEWLRDYADFGNCFIMGTSAGANIAYHTSLHVAAEVNNFEPLKIQGVILHQPFFGGVQRCQSEMRLVNDPVFPPYVADLIWELSLPIGVDRDHEYCNPKVGGGPKLLEKIRELKWRVLVIGCDGDPVMVRQIELVKMMEEKSVQVVGHFGVGNYHGVEVREPSKAKALHVVLKNFILPLIAAWADGGA